MDTLNILSRRQLLKAGTAAATVAVATSIAMASPDEDPGTRLGRLMKEISEILDTQLMGTFCAVIEPSKHNNAIVSLKPIRDVRNALSLAHFVKHAPHNALVEYHLAGVAKSMRTEHGGCWVGMAEHSGGATVYRDPNAADGVWVSFPIGAGA